MYPAYVSGPTSPINGVDAVCAKSLIASAVKPSLKVFLPSSKLLYSTMLGCLTPSAFAKASSDVAPNKKLSLSSSATSVKVALLLLSYLSKYATMTTLSAVLNSSSASPEPSRDTAGMLCLVMYETMACALRGPPYGATLSAPRKTLRVG